MAKQPSIAANWTMSPIYHGDTWDGFTLSASSDGTAFSDPLDLVTIVFADKDGTVGLTLTSAAGADITIDNASAWTFTVKPIDVFPLAAGNWSFAIHMTDDADRIKTRIVGTKLVKETA